MSINFISFSRAVKNNVKADAKGDDEKYIEGQWTDKVYADFEKTF